jgi:hypothetical protein
LRWKLGFEWHGQLGGWSNWTARRRFVALLAADLATLTAGESILRGKRAVSVTVSECTMLTSHQYGVVFQGRLAKDGSCGGIKPQSRDIRIYKALGKAKVVLLLLEGGLPFPA